LRNGVIAQSNLANGVALVFLLRELELIDFLIAGQSVDIGLVGVISCKVDDLVHYSARASSLRLPESVEMDTVLVQEGKRVLQRLDA